jgi:hypothetical protein
MPDLDAPARLLSRLDFAGTDDGVCFPTLREALSHLPQDASVTPWIVTECGKILRPGEIDRLRSELCRL